MRTFACDLCDRTFTSDSWLQTLTTGSRGQGG